LRGASVEQWIADKNLVGVQARNFSIRQRKQLAQYLVVMFAE
jgi:hypothetical protein